MCIRDRATNPKRGFPVPLADWLRQDEYYTRVKAKFTGPVAERFFDTGEMCIRDRLSPHLALRGHLLPQREKA